MSVDLAFHPNYRTEFNKSVAQWHTKDYYVNRGSWIVSPKVVVDPIPEAATQPVIVPRLAIFHSNAAPAMTLPEKLVAYWRRSDITGEGHFQVATGTTRQAMPLNRRADCNYKANSFWLNGVLYGAISFETEDNGYPTLDVTPWTFDQLQDLVGITTSAILVYPSLWCTAPARWNDKGIGYHSQFPEWSSYTGKTCPGAARIRQMDYVRSEVARLLATIGNDTGWQCGSGFPA